MDEGSQPPTHPGSSEPFAELVLYPSRTRHLLLLTLSLGFSVVGAFMVRDAQSWESWFVLVFFGLCTLVFAVQLLPSASWLRLTGEGFRFCSLFRRSAMVRWDEVGSFTETRVGHNAMVAFTTRRGAESRLAAVNRALTGETEALPDTYGESAAGLAALMNAWRDMALLGCDEDAD